MYRFIPTLVHISAILPYSNCLAFSRDSDPANTLGSTFSVMKSDSSYVHIDPVSSDGEKDDVSRHRRQCWRSAQGALVLASKDDNRITGNCCSISRRFGVAGVDTL